MEVIRNYCKQLRVLNVSNLKDALDVIGQESYASLIRSYGSRMKNATVDGLGHEHLVEIVKACTRLKVTVDWENVESVDWRQVHELGPRMVRLTFNAGILCGDAYPRAIEQCSNLQQLWMTENLDGDRPRFTEEMIENVFAPSRFPKLEHLSIRYFRLNVRNMPHSIQSTPPHLQS